MQGLPFERIQAMPEYSGKKIVEASANQAQMLAASLVQMVTTLSEAVAKLNAPKVPIRDASGRIVRIETVQ